MKRKQVLSFCFLASLLFLLVLGTSSAVQAEGVTPTSTREMLYKTPTPAPTLDYTCPVGTSIGYGSITPDTLWMASCAGCVGTPVVTGTPPPFMYGYTQTALAYQTSLPPICITAVGGGVEVCNTFTPGVPSATVTPFAVTPSVTPTVTTCSIANHPDWSRYRGDNGFVLISDNDTATTIDRTYSVSFYGDYYENWNNYKWFIADYIGSDSDHAGLLDFRIMREFISGENVTMFSWWNTWVDVSPVGGGIDVRITPVNTAHVPVNAVFRVIVEPNVSLQCPTAIPTYTPTAVSTAQSGYCSSVIGESGDPISDLPGIGLGDKTCIDLPAVTISLSSISWLPGMRFLPQEVGTPKIDFCVREIFFGYVKMFGLELNLDLLSVVVSAGLALRWLFRS